MRDAVGAGLGLDGVVGWMQVDCEIGKRFGDEHFADQHRFQRYAKAIIHPNLTTLKLFDQHYPGTRDVHEYGPGCSHLWSALGAEPAAAVGALEREWRNAVVIRDTREGGELSDYRVVPKAIAVRHKLSAIRGFPVVDARKLLQPWQRIDDYLGRWVGINSTLPGRRTLLVGPEPERSMHRARFGMSNAKNAVALPWLASLSYNIASARCFEQRPTVNLDLLARHGISPEELGTHLATVARS